jgi:peroxiredoxin
MSQFWIALVLPSALGAPCLTFGQTPLSPKSQFEAIVKAQGEALDHYQHGLSAAKTPDEQRPAVDRFLSECRKNTQAVLELVNAHPNDPIAVEALTFVIKTARGGPGDESYRAMTILLRDHALNPGMGEACWQLFWFVHSSTAEHLIRSVVEHNPNRADRGLAYHALATYLQLQARMIRKVRENPSEIERYAHEADKPECARIVKEKDPEALEREVEGLLERIVADFGDVKRASSSRTEGDIAADELFSLRSLAVGKMAPEIEGRDHQGTAFKLTDYRGKVVLLTFSGNWCGPCVAMYPHERALASKLKDNPFAAVSVNTDSTVGTLRKAIDEGTITWRCWWDGGVEGPITTRWGIAAFPSVFVIDAKGVIRFKDVREDNLEKAVLSLVAEARR